VRASKRVRAKTGEILRGMFGCFIRVARRSLNPKSLQVGILHLPVLNYFWIQGFLRIDPLSRLLSSLNDTDLLKVRKKPKP
jgi:uncharacterized RDD family membrane protein YckC